MMSISAAASLLPRLASLLSFSLPLHGVEVGYDQLGRDCLNVTDWVDASLDMVNVAVLKTAHHVHDRIDLTDVLRNWLPNPSPPRRP